jgi:hypothetical protein
MLKGGEYGGVDKQLVEETSNECGSLERKLLREHSFRTTKRKWGG